MRVRNAGLEDVPDRDYIASPPRRSGYQEVERAAVMMKSFPETGPRAGMRQHVPDENVTGGKPDDDPVLR